MSNRLFIWLLATVLLTTALPVKAQQTNRVPRVVFLSPRGGPSDKESVTGAVQQQRRCRCWLACYYGADLADSYLSHITWTRYSKELSPPTFPWNSQPDSSYSSI